MSYGCATTVAEVAVTCAELHGRDTTVGELRELFGDDHVHLALLVDRGRLVAAVERSDLRPELEDTLPARLVGAVEGRVVGPGAPVAETLARMREVGRRRL